MCEFISWVEKRGKVYFLTGKELFHSKKGQQFLKTISLDDSCGHGTIRAYYGIDAGDGVDRECTDFSNPSNFPPMIVKAIKDGDMRGLGIDEDLLTKQAWAEYEKVRQPALAEYKKVKQQAFWDLFANPRNRNELWI